MTERGLFTRSSIFVWLRVKSHPEVSSLGWIGRVGKEKGGPMSFLGCNFRTILKGLAIPGFAALLAVAGSIEKSAHGEDIQITHDTRSEFQGGVFSQTALGGTEQNPEIELATHRDFSWTLEDPDFSSGWTTLKMGQLTIAEVISGQLHFRAQRSTNENEAYALFSRAVNVPDKFAVEYRIWFERIEPAGVAVPGDAVSTQPTGACARLDIFKSGKAGLRVDIFADKMVSFKTRNPSTKDYPTTAYFNVTTENRRWYTLRFEGDFTNPTLRVQVYRDNQWIGELKTDSSNSGNNLRALAYSRKVGSLADVSIDSIRVGTTITAMYSTGTLTSPILDLGASAFGTFSWAEGKLYPYPWGTWTKFSGNPTLDDLSVPGCLVENILTDINDPLRRPLFYPHPTKGNKYWLVYANCCGRNIYLAYSDDLLHWTPYEGNPILAPGPGENYLFSPNIFKDVGIYYLVYDVSLNSAHGEAQRIAYATAPSPLGPWKKGSVILELGAPGEWDEGRVTEPFVFKDGNIYYLFYMGDPLPPYGRLEQIGLATTPASTFPRGPWVKHGLILPANPDPTAWDRGLTADPSLIKVDDTY